jgi:hypothetical protein
VRSTGRERDDIARPDDARSICSKPSLAAYFAAVVVSR